MSDPAEDRDALLAALARRDKELAALRKRYEDWRPIAEPPGEYHRQMALIHFYMPARRGKPDTWITRTWSERPSTATHWCLIVSPLGPREEHFRKEA